MSGKMLWNKRQCPPSLDVQFQLVIGHKCLCLFGFTLLGILCLLEWIARRCCNQWACGLSLVDLVLMSCARVGKILYMNYICHIFISCLGSGHSIAYFFHQIRLSAGGCVWMVFRVDKKVVEVVFSISHSQAIFPILLIKSWDFGAPDLRDWVQSQSFFKCTR